MAHQYATRVWEAYGVPFTGLGGLSWWDFEAMTRAIDQREREAARE